MTRILFSGGGSGGHLFPGIAMAEELRRRTPNCECLFVGSHRPIEAEMIKPSGFRHRGLCVPSSSSFYRSPLRAVKPFWQAYRSALALLDEFKPEVVVGLGGGISVPSVLAASRRKVPIVLLEQNAVLGRANRMLLPLAHHLCLSYAKTPVPAKYASRTSVTGNPLRSQILSARHVGPISERNCLLILGGSQGAKAINEVVLTAFSRLGPLLAGWRIIHQTGREMLDGVASAYRDLGIPATVVPFVGDIGSIYSQTGLAISRAGGTTLAELAVHGVPSVLIPYPRSVRDHQALNARRHDEAGGAVTVPQDSDWDSTAERLGEVLPPLLTNPELRTQRGAAMLSLGCPEASQRVADLVERLCVTGPSSAGCRANEPLARAS